jgi:hypothetical protein
MAVVLTTAATLYIITTVFLVMLPVGFMSHGSCTDNSHCLSLHASIMSNSLN